ncbi:hypothetical protein CO180_01330 [candidate division WWE3 bacterium CG_4_9_14_3_um_filter_41_6]|uniref:Uncharacterized protein n=1 Tax=candidate division WWE3 bacterium CG_4_10_14_0_2_um_filter_41_14 TaxID=1975072 RepID=A0A2M7TH92_UNCKA|nr:MAG: hypothetical protein COY32_05055 [candidate division WWE3 bacterium CG_4_10_14_0_2_um_filter_41_14]PJA39222.1 MAG: hypothetical protein CO180_01330 [candidate division WWE3 bacterium CG_4_9_14_3_um_filter_41_6]
MTPDLIESLTHALYTTFNHNQTVIAYVAAIFVSAVLAIKRPNRFSILMLVGFLLLGFGFEYDKHIIGPLTRQTLEAVVINPDAHVRATKVINIFLGEILPIVFYVVGWGFVFWGMILGGKNYQTSSESNVRENSKQKILDNKSRIIE